MKREGRRSAADKAAAKYSATIEPPRKLSAAEQKVWDSVQISSDRITPSDAFLLAQYCSLSVEFDRARNLADKEKAGRLLLAYARSLRLTPHSRYDARAAARSADHALDGAAADDPLLGGSAWRQN